MTAQMSVQIILALMSLFKCTLLYKSPSAGIGRQSDLKIRWYITVNVQVVSWINNICSYLYLYVSK